VDENCTHSNSPVETIHSPRFSVGQQRPSPEDETI
jgi:hypothetical protein